MTKVPPKQKPDVSNLGDLSDAIRAFAANRRSMRQESTSIRGTAPVLKLAGTINAKGSGPVDVLFTEAVNYGCGLEDGTELFIKEENPRRRLLLSEGESASKVILTARQARRREQLERFEIAASELAVFAGELGMPTRFGKALAEMTVYVRKQAEQFNQE
jgi:hypothetical protein